MGNFTHPSGFRMKFGGVNLRDSIDELPPDKFGSAVNIRETDDDSIRTRPGTSLFIFGTGTTLQDIGIYTTLGTDNKPRYLAVSTTGVVVLDNSATVATMQNGSQGFGRMLLPFRPAQSAQTWMYIAAVGDYMKLSAPSASNAVSAFKVGVAEPQAAVDAIPVKPTFTDFSALAANWTVGGTANAISDNNTFITDTAGKVIADPVLSSTRQSVQVAAAPFYNQGELLTFAGGPKLEVQDVIPQSISFTISAILYDSGTTGPCQIVPSVVPSNYFATPPGNPFISGSSAVIRRGMLLNLNNGGGNAEIVFVTGVIPGPTGNLTIRTSTVNTHTGGETVLGVPTIIVDGTVANGNAIVGATITGTTSGAGTATYSQTLSSSPFVGYQATDYVHLLMGFASADIPNITSITLIFDAGTGDYKTKIFSFTFQGGGVLFPVTEIIFPVSALGAFGTDINSLANVGHVQIQIVTSAAVTVNFGMFWIGGTGQPDIGAPATVTGGSAGIPYKYRIRGRNQASGAQGLAGPEMYYGIYANRQNVQIPLPATSVLPAYGGGNDAQVDIWDVFRYGGTVPSYHYIGSGAPSTTFTDMYFDTAALGGPLLPVDDYEPWPSLDQPFILTNSTATITAVGNVISIQLSSGGYPTTFYNWLPGTLIRINGSFVFTLRIRPYNLSSIPVITALQTVENMGNIGPITSFIVAQPIVGRQILPYVWGPDNAGTFWGCGDPLRPGVVYYTKPFAPDSAPPVNQIELTSPSEPLLGGEIINGVSMVCGVNRWWAMYPQTGQIVNTGTGLAVQAIGTYNQQDIGVGRGFAAPYGHCSDGKSIYYWAKDCIARTSGGEYEDLTTDDLMTLFPHDGVLGASIVRQGFTYNAPDYTRAATFRISVQNNWLYADYQDVSGNNHTLVMNIRTKAWRADSYWTSIVLHKAVPQPSGTLVSTFAGYPQLLLGGLNGNVYQEVDFTNDNGNPGTPISASVQTFEWDGGDLRTQPQWGDLYLDLSTVSGVSAQPMSNAATLGSATAIPGSANRQFAEISVAGAALKKFLGLFISWTDNFASSVFPTTLVSWQASLVQKPELIKDRFGDWEGKGE